ncbi:hypothetical protein [Streptomyces sp. NBC_01724]|nr:hypothetical protein [Streptomyces sp. NBC_01724]
MDAIQQHMIDSYRAAQHGNCRRHCLAATTGRWYGTYATGADSTR